MRQNLAPSLRLMLVTDDRLLRGRDLLTVCLAAVAGGVTMVQLRLKDAGDRDLLAAARTLVRGLPVPVLVNDRLDIALRAGAAGVHLGPDDIAPAIARRLAPPDFIVGASVGSEAEMARAIPADYWGIGPLRATSTKPDAGAALGWDEVARLARLAGGRPCVTIGGIGVGDLSEALSRGLAGVAVVSAILGAEDVREAAIRVSGVSTDT